MNKINKNKISNYLNYNNNILNKKRNLSVQLNNNNSNNVFFNMNNTKNYNITNYLKNKKTFFSSDNKTKIIKSDRTKNRLFKSLFNISEELNKTIDNKTKIKFNMNVLKDFQNSNSFISNNNNISSDSLSNRYSNLNSNRYSYRNKISYINYFNSRSKSFSFETFEKNTIENENMNKKIIYNIIIKNRSYYINNYNYNNSFNKNNYLFFNLNNNKNNINSKKNHLNKKFNNIKKYSSQNNLFKDKNIKLNVNNSYDNIFEIKENKNNINFNKNNYFSIEKENIKENINNNNNKKWSIINEILSKVKRKNYIKNLKMFNKENQINNENFNIFINKPINNIPLIFKELCIKITGNKNINNFEEINIKELLNYYAKKLYLKFFLNNLLNNNNNNILMISNKKINEELKKENYKYILKFNIKLLEDISLLNKRKNKILNKYKEDLEYFKEVNKFISKIK